MRQFFYQKTTENSRSPLKVMTTVEHLANYDMIYIYHHLFAGAELQLERDKDYPLNPTAVAVFYKGFKLGYLPEFVSRSVAKQLVAGSEVKVRVSGLFKNKFMPLSGLNAEIEIVD